jgi:protein-histidine N-methyltransferase
MASSGKSNVGGVSNRMENMSLGKRGAEEDIVSESVTGLKDLGNGNTTQLVGGLSLTENDSVAADRVKFFHDSVKEGKEVKEEDGDKFEIFKEWLREHGCEYPGLYMKKYTDEVRGVHTEISIPSNSQIVKVPLKLLIHEGMGQKTKVGAVCHNNPDCRIIVPAHTMVIVYILTTMRDPNHFFRPYYDILPKTFNNFPIFWTEEELSYLEGSDLVRQIRDRKLNIKADYDAICGVCPEFSDEYSLHDFLWCRTAVGSRNFGITINGVKRTTMVPFADMLNHYRPRETSWTFDNSQQSFTMTSLADMAVGQQVMDSYGKKCNSKFLLHYGFAVENNREEDGRCQNESLMTFYLPHSEDDPYSSQRLRLAGTKLAIRATMTYDEKKCQELLSYNRLCVANRDELDTINATHRNAYSLSANPIRPICARNEIAALANIAAAARTQLGDYPTTWDEDMALLNSNTLTPFSNRKNALIVVMGEKEILRFFIKLSEVCADLFSNDIEKVLEIVKKDFNGNGDIERYVRSATYAMRSSATTFFESDDDHF